MTATQWSARELVHLKSLHPISDVLGRMGIRPPRDWDGLSDYRIPAAVLGLPHGDDSSGVLIKPSQNRWWAFHAGIGGDVLDLVKTVSGAATLREAATTLNSGKTISIAADHVPATSIASRVDSERPDLARTPEGRVLAVNAQAWRYLTLPALAERAREYLRGRGIDLTALEAEVGGPLAGHTPSSPTGLTEYLRRLGFHDDEILDAGWGVRRPGRPLQDRYHGRVVLPFRDETGALAGVTGRDTTGSAHAKYLNHPRTAVFDKSAVLYRPSMPDLDRGATVIVCEGTLDALAIAAAASRTGVSRLFAPVSQSGLSLTDRIAPRIFALHPRPPILCGDGDAAGQRATAAWAERAIRVHHQEVLTLALPDDLDPAEWLTRHGDAGLITFSRCGCLDDHTHVRAQPAGALLARRELDRAMGIARHHQPNAETYMVAPAVIQRLGAIAAELPTLEATRRFAQAAGHALAEQVDGLSAESRAAAVMNAATRWPQQPPAPPMRPSPHQVLGL
jgi:DNA primase